MSNEILMNITPEETRVALLSGGILSEFYIERAEEKGVVGNLYKGRVLRVLPGMQAAFIDIGLDRAAFLYVNDVYNDVAALGEMLETSSRLQEDFAVDRENGGEPPQKRQEQAVPIEDLLKEGQEILVQVSKEPLGTKGARITSYVTLPGRNLVLMPTIDHIGISRRIDDEAERERLKAIIKNIKPPGIGFIVRTVGEGKQERELKSDMDFLLKLWNDIKDRNETVKAPALIHQDLNLTLRIIRDQLIPDIDRLLIDNRSEYERAMEFIEAFMPRYKDIVEPYYYEEPIFDAYGIEIAIAEALGRKVWLKSGGYIIIDEAEALVAIDVNTGKYVGKRNLEDTIFKTNMEAIKEIVYQIRLRNIGGIIIIDFIDMEKESNREKVFNTLIEALKADKARTNILKLSNLGLVEMTRKRTRESIVQSLCEACPYCEGRGYIKSMPTVCHEIFREIRREAKRSKNKRITLRVHPEVSDLLYDEKHMVIDAIERELDRRIIIKAKRELHQEQFEVSS
ncbi:ribonuclease E/G [Thermodesulfobacteriota bacterium]